MKFMIKVTGITLIALGMLTACGDGEEVENNDPAVDDGTTEPEDNDDEVDEHLEDDAEAESNSAADSGNLTTSNFEDQLDLSIGDTGQVSSNTGDFEMSINQIDIEQEVDEQSAQLDFFYVVDVTIKNIGEEVMSADNMVGIFDITHDLSHTGTGAYLNQYFESFEELTEEMDPGEEINAQLLFDVYSSDEHYIRVNEGLVASGGVKNQVIWTFSEDELD